MRVSSFVSADLKISTMTNRRFIKNGIYQLRKQFPSVITLSVFSASTVDLKTGVATPSEATHVFKRAILLPEGLRIFVPGTSGGMIETGERMCILDTSEAAISLDSSLRYQITASGRVWDVLSLEQIEETKSYLLKIKRPA